MDFKNFIENLERPVVIQDAIKEWGLLNYSKEDWCNVFQNQVLNFRKGDKKYRKNPYWEQLCKRVNMKLDEFFEISDAENEYWLYYDYKYLKDVFQMQDEILKEIKWSSLGFENLSGKDSTIWIGSKGAHTPCHMDTYGSNLVAQLYGRKLWILIPPEETDSLKPVRIPYEESSIYSSCNFFTPSSELLNIKKVFKVELKPGEVLYVPRHWWHYVENLETAISINVWVPLEADDESRLEEALVRNYVWMSCQELTQEEATILLNPNEHDLLTETFNYNAINLLIKKCKEYRKVKRKNCDKLQDVALPRQINEISEFKMEELKNYTQQRSISKTGKQSCSENSTEKLELVKMLINSYCNPGNVKLIKETLLKQSE